MGDNFKKPKKIDFEPEPQDPINPLQSEDRPIADAPEEQAADTTKAGTVLEEYDRAIEFMKWLEQLLRENSKVEVEIDPEDDPEVWLAMQRIFSNPSPKLNQDSYYQVLDALEVIEKIEQVEEAQTELDDFLETVKDSEEVEPDEIKDEDFQIPALDEIEEKSKVRRSSALKDPPPPKPPILPDDPHAGPHRHPWWWRWRRYYRRVNVLGRPYRVQWLNSRWWRDKKDKFFWRK